MRPTHRCSVRINENPKLAQLTKWQKWILISADNPHRLIYFRSDVSIREEQLRHLRISKWIIHPYSNFRGWYEIYLIYLYCSVLITKPIDAGYMTPEMIEMMISYRCYTIITDLLCWFDICINMVTGYDSKKNKTIELRLAIIATKYIFSPFFFCDVISSIPKSLAYLIPPFPYTSYVYGAAGILSLFKIVRLISFVKLFGKSAEFFGIMSKGLLFLVCSIIVSLLVIHWMACLQFAIPRLVRMSFTMDYDTHSWFFQHDLFRKPLLIQYIHSFFKSTAYMLGIRLTIYRQNMPEEYILAIVTYFVGKIVIAFIWIILAVAILNSRSMDIKYAEVINFLEEYMKQKQLPLNLRSRILQYFDFKYQRKYFKEEQISNMLSNNLRKEVNLHVCKSLIRDVSLFSELTPSEISKVVEYLIPEIFLPNDVIIQSGSYGDAMYFLSSGTVAAYTRSGKEICHLQDGAYFGEVSLILKHQTRLVTIVAIEASHVYRLNRKDLDKCLLHNKAVMQKIMRAAEQRVKEANKVEDEHKRMLFEQTYQKIG